MTDIPQLLLEEEKEHGTCKQIEEDFKTGDTTIVIEDVVSTGGFPKMLIY